MTISGLISLLWATDNPVLPDPVALRFALHLGWAAVLCAGALWLGTRLRPATRWCLSLTLALWALVPGSTSPTFWLGLAFQTPSLMTVVLCLLWIYSQARRLPESDPSHLSGQPLGLKICLAIGVVLGWVLLLDTLALWPVSIYAWGFSPSALGAVALLAAIVWALGAGFKSLATRGGASAVVVLSVLGLYVVTRWPSGNLWDALLDPWLWGALQIVVFRACWKRWRTRQVG
jgi:hypothetical protein